MTDTVRVHLRDLKPEDFERIEDLRSPHGNAINGAWWTDYYKKHAFYSWSTHRYEGLAYFIQHPEEQIRIPLDQGTKSWGYVQAGNIIVELVKEE